MSNEYSRKVERRGRPEGTTQAGKRKRLEPHEQILGTQGQNTNGAQLAQTQAQTQTQTQHCKHPSSAAFLEGEISPKNFGEAFGTPSSSSSIPSATDLLAPPPAKRRRSSPTPSVSNLTRASVEALLPGSAFGHAGPIMKKRHWSVKDEQMLRRSWSTADQADLVALGTSYAEVMVWRSAASIYGCTPPDLFRYGLKQSPPRDADENELFWGALLKLMVHPFWGGDVAVLRLALQLAVMRRAGRRGHVPPLSPPWSHTEPRFLEWVRESHVPGADPDVKAEQRAELAGIAQFRSRTHVTNRWGMRELESLLSWPHEVEGAPDDSLPVFERFLFMLKFEDLRCVESALACMFQGEGNTDMIPENHFAAYMGRSPANARKVTEADRQAVLEQKRMAVIGERREALIRHHLHLSRDELFLLDIPPFDPDPDFHLYSGATEAQMLAIRGQRPPPATYKWAMKTMGGYGDRMALRACGIMAGAFGRLKGAAGELFELQANVKERIIMMDTPWEARQNLPGLLFSSYITGWPRHPPELPSDLILFSAFAHSDEFRDSVFPHFKR